MLIYLYRSVMINIHARAPVLAGCIANRSRFLCTIITGTTGMNCRYGCTMAIGLFVDNNCV